MGNNPGRLTLKSERPTHRLYVPKHISKSAQVDYALKLVANGNPFENYILLHDHSGSDHLCNSGCTAYPEDVDTEWTDLVK